MQIGDIVCVTWDDAWFDLDEGTPETWLWRKRAKTYGVLTRINNVLLSVSCESFEDGVFRGTTHIPRAMVVDVEVLISGTESE